MTLLFYWFGLCIIVGNQFGSLKDIKRYRLPHGILEEYVLTLNRSQFLNSLTNNINNKYYYYNILQIFNEMNNNESMTTVYDSKLDVYFDELMNAHCQRHKKCGSFYDTDIGKIIKMYYFKNNKSPKNKQRLLDIVFNTTNIQFNHNKQRDFSHKKRDKQKVKNEENEENEYESYVSKKYIKELMVGFMSERLSRKRDNNNILNDFKYLSLPMLFQYKLKKQHKEQILSQNSKYIIKALLLYEDRKYVMDMVVDDILNEVKKKHPRLFGFRPIHHWLTLNDLEYLQNKVGYGLIYDVNFMNMYLKKLMPIEFNKYNSWSSVPIILRLKYISDVSKYIEKQYESLFGYGMNDMFYGYNLFHKITLIKNNYFHLKESYPFNLTDIIKYLYYPRNNCYTVLKKNVKYLKKYYEPQYINQIFNDAPTFNRMSDCNLIKDFLKFIFSENGRKYYNSFLDLNYKDKYYSKFMESIIMSDNKSNISQVFSPFIIETLSINIKKQIERELQNKKSWIKFDKLKNKDVFEVNDHVQIYVELRNIEIINVKIFEINTKSYFRSTYDDIKTDLNLDGLSASFEWDINTENTNDITIEFPEKLQSKRGIYFIDLISIANGLSIRAVIKIGNINYLNTICEAGHLLYLFDESNNLIKNGSVLLGKNIYTTNMNKNNGEILIPFSTEYYHSERIILQNNKYPDFNILASFGHETETYTLQTGIYMDREQIIGNQRAVIIVRGALWLNGVNRVTLDLLKNSRLIVKVKTRDDAKIIPQIFDDFKLYDDQESIQVINIPKNVEKIYIKFMAEVFYALSTQIMREFSKEETFHVNKINTKRQFHQMMLVPLNDDTINIRFHGKTGELLGDVGMHVEMESKIQKRLDMNFVNTDGSFGLPMLKSEFLFDKIKVNIKSDVYNSFISMDLNNLFYYKTKLPKIIHMDDENPIYLPYFIDQRIKGFKYFVLYDKSRIKMYDTEPYITYTNDKYIRISNLKPGSYSLVFIDMESIEIYVTKHNVLIDDRYYVDNGEIVELSPAMMLQIREVKQINNQLAISLAGYTDRTRVHVIGTHTFPAFNIEASLVSPVRPSKQKRVYLSSKASQNLFLSQRKIHEEYQYVLERQNAKKYMSNSLSRPSFLVKPLLRDTTTTHDEFVDEGNDFSSQAFGRNEHIPVPQATPSPHLFRGKTDNDDRLIDFIGNASTFKYNLKPNNEGIINVNLSIFDEKQKLVRILACDEETCIMNSIILNNGVDTDNFTYNDIRMKNDNTQTNSSSYVYLDTYNTIALTNNDEYKLYSYNENFVTMISYSNFHDYFRLMQSTSEHTILLQKWLFLKEWKNYDMKTKMEKYEEYLSHELHFYLYKYDETFFHNVCIPHINSKLYPDIIDNYFLKNTSELKKSMLYPLRSSY